MTKNERRLRKRARAICKLHRCAGTDGRCPGNPACSILRWRVLGGLPVKHWDRSLAEYWGIQPDPVMLVIRTSDGTVRWMNVTDYVRHYTELRGRVPKQIEFEGEPFTALSLARLRNKFLPHSETRS